MATKKTPIEAGKERTIKLSWGSFSDTPTVYANQLLISHTGGEFYLIFGEFVAAEIDIEKPPDEAKIKSIVKIAINPLAMMRMAEVIAENVGKFKDKVEKGQIETDGIA